MKYFNFPGFVILCLASLIPDVSQILLSMGQKNHWFPYELRSYLEHANSVPWTGIVFGITFSVGCLLAFPNSTKIRFDEIAGFTLICPLVQFLAPLLAQFAGPLLGSVGIPSILVGKFLYAALLATLCKGILGLEAIGLMTILVVGFVGAGIVALAYIPDLPFYPSLLWYLFTGGAIAFAAARKMN